MLCPQMLVLPDVDTQDLGKWAKGTGRKADGLIENVALCVWIPRSFPLNSYSQIFSHSLALDTHTHACAHTHTHAHARTHMLEVYSLKKLNYRTSTKQNRTEPSITEESRKAKVSLETRKEELHESLQNEGTVSFLSLRS